MGLNACLTHFHGCERSLLVMVESMESIRKMLLISVILSASPVLCRARTSSDHLQSSSATDSDHLQSSSSLQLIFTQFQGILKVLSHLVKGTLRRGVSEKKPHPALTANVQVHSLASSEAELQEGRYWLLLPHMNAEDRIKRKGEKKSFHG